MSAATTEIPHCRVCGNHSPDGFDELYRYSDFAVVKCRNCSCCFVPYFYREKISYQEYKDESVAAQVRAGNNWIKEQRHLLRFDLIRKYKPSGSLFDIGSGWGHFLAAGKKLGYDVYGVELANQPYLYSKNELNLPVDRADFLQMNEERKFDVLTMWDVLEHIDMPDKFIEKCSKLQNAGGYLFIQVPQIDSYIAKRFKSKWKMISLDHVNYFSKETMKKLLSQHGYEVVQLKSSIEIKLFIMYTLYGWLRKSKPTRNQSTSKEISATERQAFFNKITRQPEWVLRLFISAHHALYHTLSALGIGEEMAVVARRIQSTDARS
jgi:2-polyprenyl-3-methyl-5-hydroxy-6-metoxy-1,4-benzoquinol methylase